MMPPSSTRGHVVRGTAGVRLRIVTGKVDELRRRGDADGVAAWTKVAAVLSQAMSPNGDRPEKAHARLY
jgi:hypothetical protein